MQGRGKKGGWKRVRLYGLRLLLLVGLFFGGGELVLRMMGYADGPCQFYDPEIGLRFYPNQSRTMLDDKREIVGRMHTNEMGYRGPWYPEARRPGIPRIVCLGDSFTFGWSVRDDQTYPIVLERLIEAREATPEAEVCNLGLPGYNTRNEYNVYEKHARALKPDVVVLGFFENDAQPDSLGPRYTDTLLFDLFGKTAWMDAFHKHLRHRIRIFDAGRTPELKRSLQVFFENAEKIRREPGSELAKPYWDDVHAALEDIAAACERDGVPLLVVIFPSSGDVAEAQALRERGVAIDVKRQPRFSVQRLVTAWSEELGVDVLDLLVPLASCERPFDDLTTGHPNAQGYAESARAILAKLESTGIL